MGLALAAWGALITTATLRGNPIRKLIKLQAPPLIGEVDPRFGRNAVLALLLGLVLVALVPRWCARLRWRRLLAVMVLVALGFGVALALTRGPSRLELGLDGPYEYPVALERVDQIGVGRFVRTFSDPEILEDYPIHVEGHPVGATLVFVALDRIGLGGLAPAAGLMILAGATSVAAVLLAVREVAGEARARQTAPFLALTPSLVWMVTSADALFTAVAAWAIALLVLSTGERRSLRDRRLLALAGGVAFGIGLHLSYGLAPLVMVPTIVVAARRRWETLAFAALGGALVAGCFTAFGFWWFDGLAATRIRYAIGVARRRPFRYFAFLGNPAAFAIACGPAIAVAVTRVRDRGLWLLGGAAILAVAGADLSGLSKGEIERIWLPFVPWVLVLCGGLAQPAGRSIRLLVADLRAAAPVTRDRRTGGQNLGPGGPTVDGVASPTTGDGGSMSWSGLASFLLAVQVVAAVVLESFVLTPW